MLELDLGAMPAMILVLVRDSADQGIDMKQLRHVTGLSQSGLSSHLSRLMRKGLVRVIQDEVDMRTRRVWPSD